MGVKSLLKTGWVQIHGLANFATHSEENLGRSKRLNPRYVKIRDAMSRARSQGEFEKRQKLRTLLHRTPSKHAQDPNYRRVVYRRYRDQFVVGVIGPKSFVFSQI